MKARSQPCQQARLGALQVDAGYANVCKAQFGRHLPNGGQYSFAAALCSGRSGNGMV